MIYDIYLAKEDLLEGISFSVDTVKMAEENDVHHVFDESPKSEVSQLGLEKITFVEFIKINQEHVKINYLKLVQRTSYLLFIVMMGCKLFLFWYSKVWDGKKLIKKMERKMI